jgi:hypothetical protein
MAEKAGPTTESGLLYMLRPRHYNRVLIVEALCSCSSSAPVSMCHTRRCHSRRLSVRRSWMRPLAHPPCCHAAGSQWTWMRLCRSNVQLPCPGSGGCDGATPVSTSLSRHCHGQHMSVRRSFVVVQACRQHTLPTTHVRCLSTSCRRSYPSTLTSVSC